MLFLEAATETTTEASKFDQLLHTVLDWCTSTGIKIIIALVVLIIGLKVVDVVCKKLLKKLEKNGKADRTLSRVFINLAKISLKALLLICIVGYLGFETTSLSAVVLSLGTGIALAVQGTLGNFAGGVIIVVMRPFKIGDFITSNGESGTVEDIKLFYTHIVTPDNRVIMIPNGSLANNVIVNVSAKDTRRVDVTMNVSYSADVQLAKNLIAKVCQANELILKDPSTFIDVCNYAESSIDIVCRAWVKSSDYWTVYFYLLNEIKKEFDAAGIEIPFNQLDVNVRQA